MSPDIARESKHNALSFLALCALITTGLLSWVVAYDEVPQFKQLPPHPDVTSELAVSTEETVRVDEPIMLRQTIHNRTSDEILVVAGPMFYGSRIEVLSEDGKEVELTRYAREYIAIRKNRRSYKSVPVPAGGKEELTIPLSRLFDMTTTGKYTITVKRHFGIPATQQKHSVTAGPLTVNVIEPPVQ